MSELQITIGNGSESSILEVLLSGLGPAMVGAVAALLGAYLTSRLALKQQSAANVAEDKRRAEDRADREQIAKQAGAFAALEMAGVLEKYAQECAETITVDLFEFYPADDDAGYHYTVDAIESWGTLDWHSLGANWTALARKLEADIARTKRILSDALTNLDVSEPTFQNYLLKEAARLGQSAHQLAARVRADYDLPPHDAEPYLSVLTKTLKAK